MLTSTQETGPIEKHTSILIQAAICVSVRSISFELFPANKHLSLTQREAYITSVMKANIKIICTPPDRTWDKMIVPFPCSLSHKLRRGQDDWK
jgi:hypothetical protein